MIATLPDWLGHDLRLISVGLNPSLRSVQAGFPFANPQNRFWRAFDASGLIDERVEPGPAGMARLLEYHRIGFTDVVKRPTPGAAQLRVADFRAWAPLLTEKLLRCAPRVVWFHGKVAYRAWTLHGGLKSADIPAVEPDWGLQAQRIGSARVFVTPNPSPANAGYSLENLIVWYRRLADVCR